jgi:hypothetical protein
MAETRMQRIDPEIFRHPSEREAMARLEKIPKFHKILDIAAAHIGGKAERRAEIASMVRVSSGVYPRLAEMWRETLANFGLIDAPLHISFLDAVPWTLRGDEDHPRAILSSIMLDVVPEDEMAALLAMIAGGFRLGHAKYMAVGDFLRWMQDFSGIAGAPAVMLSWGFENWRRAAVFSADRAAALAVRDPRPVLSLLERLAGAKSKAWDGAGDAEHLRLQGLEAAAWQTDWRANRWQRLAMAMNRRNNAALVRRLDLAEWTARDHYRAVLDGEDIGPGPDPDAAEDMVDPGLAFWGEFAAPRDDDDEALGGGLKDAAESLRDAAEQGVNSVLKAGEAFWKSFFDRM